MNSIEQNKTENQDSRTIPFNIQEMLRGYDHMNKKSKQSNKMTFIIIYPNEIITKNGSGGTNSQATLSTKKSFASFN